MNWRPPRTVVYYHAIAERYRSANRIEKEEHTRRSAVSSLPERRGNWRVSAEGGNNELRLVTKLRKIGGRRRTGGRKTGAAAQ